MAVDATSKIQNANYLQKPSRMAFESPFYSDGDLKRQFEATLVQGALVVASWVAPWAGVIEEVLTVQQVAGGGGGGQNSLTMTVAGVTVWQLATDGNTMLDNVAAGSAALTYPTSLATLVANNDGVSRIRFNKGDMIAIGAVAGGGAYGTARTRIAISKEYPAAAV